MLMRSAWNALYVLLAAIGAGVFMWFGPGVEEVAMPVLSDQRVSITRDGANLKFDVVLRKNRDCVFVSIGWQAIKTNSVTTRNTIMVRGPEGIEVGRGLGVTYPPGTFRNGPFTATLPPDLSMSDQIVGRIKYRCHWLWPTMQTYGPWPIPRPPPALAG